MSYIVEFLGLPGAGKSTVVEQMANRSGQFESQQKSTRWPRWLLKSAYCLRGTLRHRSFGFGVLLGDAVGPEVAWHVAAKLRINWLKVVGAPTRAVSTRGIVLVDQGTAQALWSELLRRRAPVSDETDPAYGLFAQAIRSLGLRQLVVVYLDASSELAAQRRALRTDGASPLDTADESPDLAYRAISATAATLGLLRSPSSAALGVRVLTVDAAGTPSEVAYRAEEALRRHFEWTC